jgi:hypothetical protein
MSEWGMGAEGAMHGLVLANAVPCRDDAVHNHLLQHNQP